MDPTEAFRQGLGFVNKARQARSPRARESSHESEERSTRIAHTLAACCRCRQRKTRCDPTLPKCIPCERVGAVCEYHDTAKGKKMSRTYVIRLQDRVRALEATLAQYLDEDSFDPKPEDAIRPGGLVRLDGNDDTPRFLGPSSGIAMTRLVMEEAKKYTESRSIRELVPEVSQRRTPAQSPDAERKRSYPMISAIPAPTLPSRLVTDKLVEVFCQKSQYLHPTLHEPTFLEEIEEVYAGSADPYKNYIIRMVLAISMQKLDTQYAGLADSYYLAAMAYVEAVIRPKDLRTLQCLVLIAQYSLLTPTRTAIYYIVGLAVRVAQQLGLTEEKTIVSGVSTGMVDLIQLDLKRRLYWIILSMEMGLSHSLGRPSGFATGEDHVDVGPFELVDDIYITKDGILPGPPSEKKIMAEHFFKMRLLQAEIRRVLYQRKRAEPTNDEHPWFAQMERKLQVWLDAAPSSPSWSKGWFTRNYNTILVFLFRPSPQIPKPSVRAANFCYDACAFNIKMQNQQMNSPTSIDITWIFLQSLFMALNTILWVTSFPEIRNDHSKEEVEELAEAAISIITRCKERWPGSGGAAQLYSKLTKACLKSYTATEAVHSSSSLSASSPASYAEPSSPQSEHSIATTASMAFHKKSMEPHPAFGYVFDQAPDTSAADEYHKSLGAPQRPPYFRSGSIFVTLPSRSTDRRFSYFPPEQTQHIPSPPNPQMWNQVTLPTANAPLHVNTSTGSVGSVSSLNDPSYFNTFMTPSYHFGPQLTVDSYGNTYDMPDRQGSLSLPQQQELLQSLEVDGLNGIDSYLQLNPRHYFSHSSQPNS